MFEEIAAGLGLAVAVSVHPQCAKHLSTRWLECLVQADGMWFTACGDGARAGLVAGLVDP
ncbi:hypothetical protein I553_5188 [Mycobacterium xenopi 4042]|uniref:Uncharacterized protein n=1 Tax=Mycobacterium xenopi 4042 TaxID=1299334 RepID=X7ZX43_MYCXE|nr:hypothetical protein I553_5188 [Mycobacterium xenopi 4042]